MQNLYHEKQKLLLCGLCAVNNLLQNQQYTKQSMNELADKLPNVQNSLFNQHSSILKIGNYSADLLITALEQAGKKVVYFDKRKFDNLQIIFKDHRVLGLLLNKVQKSFLITTNHWIAILQKNSMWYNLDGKLKECMCFDSSNSLMDFLKKDLQNLSIFIVYDDLIQELHAYQQVENFEQNSNKQEINIEQEQIDEKQQQTDNEKMNQQQQQQQQQQLDCNQQMNNQEHINFNQQTQNQTLKDI